MTDPARLARLQQGIRALGQDPEEQPCEAYLAYLDLLARWNRAYNLTAIREPGRMLTHHILDSLAVRPYVHGRRCLDLGSGAGLPGLVLALSLPDTHWVLLDSNRKKVRFLNQAVLELGPANVEVVAARAEDYRPEQRFDTITCRALTSLGQFRALAAPMLAPGGRLLAMKGTRPGAELAELGAAAASAAIHELVIEGVPERRHLVVLQASE